MIFDDVLCSFADHLHKTIKLTHIRDNDGELGVQCMIDLSDGSFVTPERVVILCVFGVRVPRCREELVPRCGIGVRLWDTVGRLPAMLYNFHTTTIRLTQDINLNHSISPIILE